METTSLTKDQIIQIEKGEKPSDIDQQGSVAFDAAMELVRKPGPLGKEMWEKLMAEFGQEGALALVHYVGVYAYTCVLLNGCDVPLPGGEKIF